VKDLEVELYAVIMAGGVGTRLWPRSRQRMPKQLLDIVADDTMLQETFLRIEPLISPERVFVITNGICAPIVREQIPQLPSAVSQNRPSFFSRPCRLKKICYVKKR